MNPNICKKCGRLKQSTKLSLCDSCFSYNKDLEIADRAACYILNEQHNYTIINNFWSRQINPIFHILAGHPIGCKLIYITDKEVLSNNISLRIKEFSKLFHKCSAEQWIWNKDKKRFTGMVFL